MTVLATGSVRPPASPPRRPRAGFTFVEILMVFVIFGILVSFAAPRLVAMRDGSSVRSAMQKFGGLALRARSAARREKGTGYLYVNADSAWAKVRSSTGTVTQVGQGLRLQSDLGVTTSAGTIVVAGTATETTLDSVTYDLRGVGRTYRNGQPTPGQPIKLRFTANAKVDSVCINALGLVGVCGS